MTAGVVQDNGMATGVGSAMSTAKLEQGVVLSTERCQRSTLITVLQCNRHIQKLIYT